MQKKRKISTASIRKVIELFMIGFMWWALFYPDLYLVENDCCVVECENDEKEYTSYQKLNGIFEASPDRIQIKSRFYDWFLSWNKEH